MSEALTILSIVLPIVIVLPLTLSESGAALISRIFCEILIFVWPNYGRCERLVWNDIPSGELHDCGPQPSQSGCVHGSPSTHENQRECWLLTIAQVLNRGWNSPSRRTAWAKKPRCLELRRNYVCCDVPTVLAYAYLVSQVRGVQTDINGYTHPPLITTEIIDDKTLVAHLQGRTLFDPHFPGRQGMYSHIANITKEEFDRVLAGYPANYRSKVSLLNGVEIEHPVHSFADISRGTWTIMQGFRAPRNPPAADPNRTAGLYFNASTHLWQGSLNPEAQTVYSHGSKRRFHPSSVSVIQVIQFTLLRCFPDSRVLKTTLKELYYLTFAAKGAGSWVCYDESKAEGLFDAQSQMIAPQGLEPGQYALVTKVFDGFPAALSDSEKIDLKPLLLPIMQAALIGVQESMYFHQPYRDVEDADWFQSLKGRRHVYIRDCAAE